MRYALSSDEFLIEIRDKKQRNKHVVSRLCQTLSKSIDVGRSEVQLLVDFIVVKLHKQESGEHWRELGYDIANFTVPQAAPMKSNFLQSNEPEPTENDGANDEENKDEAPAVKTPEEIEEERQKRIHDAMHRARHAAQSYLTLSCETIYDIH